ncbi:MAG: lipoprotein insertase outer membrane protein LolB [Gammaproteobacteria bacterium]|nr:lipoprotein insertase outer membrane protein LolB [Gammaproteobacteria bacterium]MDH5652409.1 lipoprotein insertase outer membrane protein LolB [Gammaproteobacteria bacterium]
MKRLVVLVITLLVSACQSMPEKLPQNVSWETHQAEISAVRYWFATGRVAIKNGTESWHVNLLWLQQADVYQVRLYGPFGAGQVHIKGNRDGAELQTSDEKHFARDVDFLLYETTGVRMPVSELRYWMVGLPSPNGHDTKQVGADGRLEKLQQADWQVDYKRYTVVNGVTLPKKIFARNSRLDVRVVIDKWELGVPNEDNPFNDPG